jgi:hypothetical protein
MVGSDLWLPKNSVVATVILWYKPQNLVDPTVLFLGTLSYRTRAHVGLCTTCKYIHTVLFRGTLLYRTGAHVGLCTKCKYIHTVLFRGTLLYSAITYVSLGT